MRETLASIAEKTGEWAGIPCPIEGERLIIEPSYPWAEALGQIGRKEVEDDGWRIRNSWYSLQRRGTILIAQSPEGKISYGLQPGFHHIAHSLATLGCSVAWGIEQEQRALQLLGGMLRHHAFKHYLLTGMFLERSERSGVTYLFRRLKPTVAIAAQGSGAGAAWRKGQGGDGMKILAALCMHPIAYYEGSWAGAMCPTDDVIAHLSMMRGDEAMFWRRCNQHPPYLPEAGL